MHQKRRTNITYLPHGINEKVFRPLTEEDESWEEYQKFCSERVKDKDFVVFWNNRNIRRKSPSDVIMAYRGFCDKLSKEEASRCILIMHTAPVDGNGTDLPAVINAICPMYDIMFSTGQLPPNKMNFMYNLADVTVNIASAEGFGLATAESLMSGTPIIVGVTGGLQDQCGFFFTPKGENSTEQGFIGAEEYIDIHSLHHEETNNRYLEERNLDLHHGEWAFICYPKSRNLVGSIPTPYIYDDFPRHEDVTQHLLTLHSMTREERKALGKKGREYMLRGDTMLTATAMCKAFVDQVNMCIDSFEPVKPFTLYKV